MIGVVATDARVRASKATAPSARPGSSSRGLLIIQAAILRDAAAKLGRIEWQMAGSRSRASVIQHRLEAVEVLEHTVRLLGAQQAALLERLADVGPVTDQ